MKLYNWNMSRFWRHLKPRRKYKDKLFQRVFSDKKDLLDLYNAVNQTSYTNPDDLEITTLEDVIYLSMKNDLSFIISVIRTPKLSSPRRRTERLISQRIDPSCILQSEMPQVTSTARNALR